MGSCYAGYICDFGGDSPIPYNRTGSFACPMGFYCPAGASSPSICPLGMFTFYSGAIQQEEVSLRSLVNPSDSATSAKLGSTAGTDLSPQSHAHRATTVHWGLRNRPTARLLTTTRTQAARTTQHAVHARADTTAQIKHWAICLPTTLLTSVLLATTAPLAHGLLILAKQALTLIPL